MLLDADNTLVTNWSDATQIRIPPLYYTNEAGARKLVTPKNLGDIANSKDHVSGSASMINLYNNSDDADKAPCGCYQVDS